MEFKSYEEKLSSTRLKDTFSDIQEYIPIQIVNSLELSYNIDNILKNVSEKFWLKLIEPINQGKVHYVYKCLWNDGKSYILKIRCNHFRTNKNIHISPSLITDEFNAYNVIQWKMKDLVAEVIDYDENFNYLLLSYLPYNSIENIIHSMNESIMDNIAKELGLFHKTFSNTYIRNTEKENIAYKNFLYYRFWFLKDNRISNFMKQMYKNRNSLIHWDITPENILFNGENNTIKLIDLETVHFGNCEFDIWFFLAHILIQNFNDPNIGEMISHFLKTYLSFNEADINLIYKNIWATILYRINSGFKYYNENDFEPLINIANYILDNNITSDNNAFSHILPNKWN